MDEEPPVVSGMDDTTDDCTDCEVDAGGSITITTLSVALEVVVSALEFVTVAVALLSGTYAGVAVVAAAPKGCDMVKDAGVKKIFFAIGAPKLFENPAVNDVRLLLLSVMFEDDEAGEPSVIPLRMDW